MAEGRQGGNGVRAEPHNDSESKGGEKGEGTPSSELALLGPRAREGGPRGQRWHQLRVEGGQALGSSSSQDKMGQGVGGHKVLIPLVSRIFSPERPPAPIHPSSKIHTYPDPKSHWLCSQRPTPKAISAALLDSSSHTPALAGKVSMCRARSPIPLSARCTKKIT